MKTRVMYVRKERGMSQAALARAAEINQSSMSRIENGIEPAYTRRGQRIAAVLGWKGDPAELFEEVADDELAHA